MAIGQENLHSVDKSTLPDSLQNESQELEMQGNPLEAVITKPYHLPECPQFCDGKPPKCRGGDCTLCDEVDCYCDRLRACEQRLIREGRTRGAGVWHDGYGMGYADALDAAEQAVNTYADETHQHKGDAFGICRIDEGDRCDITAALAVVASNIRAVKEKQRTENGTDLAVDTESPWWWK